MSTNIPKPMTLAKGSYSNRFSKVTLHEPFPPKALTYLHILFLRQKRHNAPPASITLNISIVVNLY